MRLIDFHTHLMPEPLIQAAVAQWQQRVGPPWYRGTLDGLLGQLVGGGIDHFGVMPFATQAGQARELNRWSAGLARSQPRAIALGTFHPGDEDLPDLVTQAFDELDLPGAELHCQAGQFYPDDRRLFPLYERAVALGRVVVLHTSRQPMPSRYVGSDPFYQLMRRFPRLRVVVAHLGADELDTFFGLATEFDHLYLETSLVFCEPFSWQPRLEQVVEFQDRIIYGSGFPITPCDLRRGVDAIKRLGLGSGIEDKLFYANAARVLGLEA